MQFTGLGAGLMLATLLHLGHARRMDWKLFASTFAAVFLAEMGDKTQIATMSLSGASSSRWSVFAGSALALVATSAIAVLLGGIVSRYVPAVWVKRAAGAVFIVLGVVYLASTFVQTDPTNQ